MKNSNYIPALRYSWLTRFYDPVVAATTREATFRQMLLDQADIKPTDQVLDLACGTGTFALLVKKSHPDVTVVGQDGDPNILGQARRKAENAGLDVTFDEGLSTALPYETDTFDFVFSSLFFHHLITEDKSRSFAEVLRVLKPGGVLHVCDWGPPARPLSKVMFTAVRLLDGFEVTQDNIDGRLVRSIENSGFSDVKVEGHVETFLGTLDLISARKNSNYRNRDTNRNFLVH